MTMVETKSQPKIIKVHPRGKEEEDMEVDDVVRYHFECRPRGLAQGDVFLDENDFTNRGPRGLLKAAKCSINTFPAV